MDSGITFCSSCGEAVSASTQVCGHCGHKVGHHEIRVARITLFIFASASLALAFVLPLVSPPSQLVGLPLLLDSVLYFGLGFSIRPGRIVALTIAVVITTLQLVLGVPAFLFNVWWNDTPDVFLRLLIVVSVNAWVVFAMFRARKAAVAAQAIRQASAQ